MTPDHAILLLVGIAWLNCGVFLAGYILGYADREGEPWDSRR